MYTRHLHPDFSQRLQIYDPLLVDLFLRARNFVLDIYPDANELLYHTHALTAVFSPSIKLGDAYIHIPIYSQHLNLGFNRGALLDDPQKLLKGTGKLIRHVKILSPKDLEQPGLKTLAQSAVQFALGDMDSEITHRNETIAKW